MQITEFSTKRRVTVAMFTLAVILFGFVSFFRLKINLLPELSYPTLTIRTEYAGAAPAEVENLISKPIEEALGVVKNVNRVSSISRSGQSDVVLEFGWGTNMDYAGLDAREKLDALELPLEIQRPTILRFDPSLDPVMRFAFSEKSAVAGDDTSTATGRSTAAAASADTAGGAVVFDEERLKFLRRFAEEEIKKELEAAFGVAAVKVSGGLEDEIQVFIDQGRLAQINVPIEQLSRQIGAENVNLSGGRLEEGTQQYLVRTLNQFQSIDEIDDIIVATKDGKPVYLRDVATVRHGYRDRDAITRLNGREAVEIAIYKEGDANTVAVAREITKRLRRVQGILPKGTQIVKVYDQSIFITRAVNEVISNAAVGGLLAVIILYFFLQNFWSTVIISLSIPVSVIATFNLMFGANLTLNIMSLGGIALGIGMLVDNSIVVLDNISRHRERGERVIEAVQGGASEVARAVTASTFTTVAVFLPLIFVKGISGQLFRDQALTVTFSLIASLLVALTLIPMLASLQAPASVAPLVAPPPAPPRGRVRGSLLRARMFVGMSLPVAWVRFWNRIGAALSRGARRALDPALRLFRRTYEKVEARYGRFLAWSLAHRARVIVVALGLFVAAIAIVPTLGVELIPQLSQGEFRVEFRLPPGTPLAVTDASIAEVEASAGAAPNIATMFSVAGTGNRMDADPEQGGENWGELNVMLRPRSVRADEERAMDRLRKYMAAMPDVQYKFSRPTLFTFKTPIEIEVSGFDLNELKRVSNAIADRLETSLSFTDVKSTMRSGHPEIQIRFDRERAAALGLPVYQIAERVVDQVRGSVATKYSYHDRKIDVLVRASEDDRNSVEKIEKLIVNPESNFPVTLDAVADVSISTGPGEIRRADQERVALVTANLSHRDLGAAAEEINAIIGSIPMSAGIGARLAGQNQEMAVSFRSLLLALLLAVFLVYLVMAAEFESFLHPFVIMFTIPLALIGAIFALRVAGATISVVVFIGLILLAGIVVNNAIVLIDFINQLRGRGMKKTEAIIAGGHSRLRPILMTTLTTVLGLIPLALGIGEGAEIRSPMAITVIGGLTGSTLLTLIVIPVVYSVLDRKE
jgi:HAE1 family hydrophobic/amphiphilic exporter-1